jgi:DNA-binding XRE family transcriptional regulator
MARPNDDSYHTTPVTAASPPGGRPRLRSAPDTAFSRWLEKQGRTVTELAGELGITRWAVYKLRNGDHQPSLEVAQKIARLSTDADSGEVAVPESSWAKPERPAAAAPPAFVAPPAFIARARRKIATAKRKAKPARKAR